jgi:hypothetical protein
MSLIYRLEHKKSGKGIFDGRHDENVKHHILELINDLGKEHRSPYSEDAGYSLWDEKFLFPLRKYEDAIAGKKGKECHFAFTEYAFENKKIARGILRLVKETEDIVLRKIENPEIIWVARSGIQVVFLDKQKKEKSIKEEMDMFNELLGEKEDIEL